jgi:N-acyl-D-amino-acid deacylase
MFARPAGLAGHKPDGKPLDTYYACGWEVCLIDGKLTTFHFGHLSGTSSMLVRRFDNMTWAILFNSCDGTKKDKDREPPDPAGEIDAMVHEAVDAYLHKLK